LGPDPLGGHAATCGKRVDSAIGEADEEKMRFPRLALRDAIEAFTLVAYGERLTFEHA
jgi:hypothetical protein